MLLLSANLRYLLNNPWQVILAVLGISLGVAVVIAVDLANSSARQAFHVSTELVSGSATHQIVGGPSGLPENIYRDLRLKAGIYRSSPIVDGYAASPRLPDKTVRILGVDVVSRLSFTGNLAGAGIEGDVKQLLLRSATGLMSKPTAQKLGLHVGDVFIIKVRGRPENITIVGLISPSNELARQAMEYTILMDVGAAQRLLHMQGRLSRINLVLPPGSRTREDLKKIADLLPFGATVLSSNTQTNIMEQMTQAFQTNLTALSLLALLVGMFLIYNTMTFSVIQRRAFFGTMRAIGVTRRQVFVYLIIEASLVGFVATGLGLILGVVLGNGLLKLVTRTINDLYFVLSVTQLHIGFFSLSKGIALGLGATLFSSLIPAVDGMRTPPRVLQSRSAVETRAHVVLPRAMMFGGVLLLLGAGLLLIPSRSLTLSFSGLFLLVIGFSFVAPSLIVKLAQWATPVMNKIFGVIGRMSARSIINSLSRTGVAIVALSVAISTTIGVGIMIDSFRTSVIHWLEQRLRADIYLSMANDESGLSLDKNLIKAIRNLSGVAFVSTGLRFNVESRHGLIQIFVLQGDQNSISGYEFEHGDTKTIGRRFFSSDSVVISEPYAYHNKLKVGDFVRIRTDKGLHVFPIIGIYKDYGSGYGIVTMSRETYGKYWENPRVTGLGIYVKNDVLVETLMTKIRDLIGTNPSLVLRSNQSLREASIKIFDRTFTITAVLRLLVIFVAFVGILSAFMAIQLERAKELAVLRANGLTPSQLWGLVSTETGLMGLIAGVLALPLGTTLALVLIYVVNRRSFGWTMNILVEPSLMVNAVLLSVIAALVAGLYPAFRMARTSPALALREE